MTSQIATLQAALTTAAKDASDALAKATAAETAAKAAGDAAAADKSRCRQGCCRCKGRSDTKLFKQKLRQLKRK